MEFGFDEDQELFRQSVRSFVEQECAPDLIRKLDRDATYPTEILAKMAPLGWYSAFSPENKGGLGLGPVYLAIMTEELSRFSLSVASAYYITMWGVLNLNYYGTEEQRKHYLPKVNEGKQNFSFSMTEPDAGSDAASLRTSAVLDGDEWVINGGKLFCTQAGAPNNTLILCVRTATSGPKHQGISMIFVPTDAKGLTLTRMELLPRRMLGTYELHFDNVRVPKSNLLGEQNRGWEYMVQHLERERMCVAAGCVGHAEQVLDDLVKYLRDRKQFGQPLSNFQAIRHTVAEFKVQVNAARLLVYKVAWMLERGLPCNSEAAQAKLFASELLVKLSFEGMRLLGGYGLSEEFPMARSFRESLGSHTGGGSANIQRNIIARDLLGPEAKLAKQ